MVSLSIFFPCHNEQDHVERMARRALEVGRTITVDLEVIIVNDGSTDRTGAIADELASEDPSLRVIHHPRNMGYRAALRSGFTQASKEWVFYTDGDGQFDIGELPAIVPLTGESDIISCFRIDRQDPWTRRVYSHAWNQLVRVVVGLRMRDVNCAFKLFRREIFQRIEMNSHGTFIDTEILTRAQRQGYRITQRGVRHYPRTSGAPCGANPRIVLQAFRELFRLRRGILSESAKGS